MNFDTIEYNGVEYPCRDVYVSREVGTINVSTEDLSAALNPNDDWDAVGEEEEYIDSKVYFYAPKEVLLGSAKDLQKYVRENT